MDDTPSTSQLDDDDESADDATADEADSLLGRGNSAAATMDLSRPDWYIPNWAPKSSNVVCALLVFSSCITSTVCMVLRIFYHQLANDFQDVWI
jgi:hypothetical protein